MSFSLAGSVITQSGTDANLSGLSAIAGVTTTTVTGFYGFTTYNLVGLKLTVTGTLTISSTEKLIFSNQGASSYILLVEGVLNIFESYVVNSYTSKLPIEAIVFCLSSSGDWNTEVISLQSSGTITAYNAIFRIPHSIWFRGTAYFENCTFDKRGSSGDIQTNHASGALTLRLCSIYADNRSGLTFRSSTVPTIDRVTVFQARDAWNDETVFSQIVRGLTPAVGNLVDMSQWSANSPRVVNAKSGVQFLWGGHDNAYRNEHYGTIAAFQEVTPTVRTTAGAAIVGATWYLTDTIAAADSAHTSHLSPTGATINPAVRQVYIVTSDGSGNVAMQNVLIGAGKRTVGGTQFGSGNDNRIRPRGKNTTGSFDATDDIYDAVVWSYAHVALTLTLILKGGELAATIPCAAVLSVDPAVTLSKAAATALTVAATLDDVYDLAKLWKVTAAQTNLEFPNISTQVATSVGTLLDLGTANVVVDATAVAVFAINTGTNTVTIKASALAVGTKFIKLVTTGTITFSNGAAPSATLVYQSSAGTSVPVTASNLIAGSRVQIFDVPNAVELANVTIGSGGYVGRFIWSVDKIIRLRANFQSGVTGKLPIESTANLTNLGASFLATQDADTIYATNGVDGSTVTEFAADYPNIQMDITDPDGVTTVQRIYAWWRSNSTTATGIANFFKGLVAEDEINYRVNTGIVNLKLDNRNVAPVIIAGGRIYRDNATTVIAAASGSIQMDPDKAYSVETGVSGLTAPEAALLASIAPIRNLIEADEIHTSTTVQKKLKGTATVLLTKTISGIPLNTFQAIQ